MFYCVPSKFIITLTRLAAAPAVTARALAATLRAAKASLPRSTPRIAKFRIAPATKRPSVDLFPPAAPPTEAAPAEIRRVRPQATPAEPPTALPQQRAPKVDSESKFEHLTKFNKKYLGASDYDVTAAALGEIFYSNLTTCNDALLNTPRWRQKLPTRLNLFRTKFGQQDLNHSFGQEACFETTLLHTLCSGYLVLPNTVAVCGTHPLIGHLAATKVAYANHDFR